MTEINVYTDGACSKNGRKGAVAGYGVYFKPNDDRNDYGRVIGKQTNNTGELTAIIKAITILKSDLDDGKTVNIYTDSEYASMCCTSYGAKLAAQNWKRKTPIPNLFLVKEAYELTSQYPNIRFHHIAAHTGKQDVHSLGNEGADKMANLAIGQTECEYANVTHKVRIKKRKKLRLKTIAKNTTKSMTTKSMTRKIYLNIPYEEKEEGKKLGMRWDPRKKKWYIPTTLVIDETTKQQILERWGR